ncbi:MAG: NAD(P)/FAD-dependent oxidoreductase, partial [Lachnospiraceae bacterium]|nr:NAD(P)/FAD-dependent oxidoreductase [Lachnospiraceae bacterium]
DISQKKLKALFDILSSFTFDMTGYAGFEKAQTSSGGLSLSEVDPYTMELLKFPGLFVTGELLDCDGICGGYNLHFAFATGRLAGKALAGGK